MAKSTKEITLAKTHAEDLFASSLKKLKEAVSPEEGEPLKFFKDGIELIDVSIEFTGVKLAVKVTGPKPNDGLD